MSAERSATLSRRTLLLASTGIVATPLAAFTPLDAADRALPAPAELRVGRDQDFNRDWRFARGSGADREAADHDDRGWRSLDVPHDWSIEDLPPAPGAQRIGPIDAASEGGLATAFALGGEGWYRKHFDARKLPPGAKAELVFDGVYGETTLWLNGRPIGEHVHGYTPFRVDLTPYLRRGANVLAIRVRNLGKNSRWYSGSGLYRGVTLDVWPEAARIAPWGVFATTARIAADAATVAIATTIEGATDGLTLSHRLRDAAGRVVAEVAPAATAQGSAELTVRSPALWSPDRPVLYTLDSVLRRGDTTLDRVTTRVGLRIVTVDPVHGMRINGTPIKLRGGCVHHDNGLLGAAAYPDAEERRVRLLKARGYNAIRSSHNPASAAFTAACDRLGMLLIHEAFDMWHVPKNPQDYAQYFDRRAQDDLADMVRATRNCPSVIMWSIGNEIPGRLSPRGRQIAWQLADTVHRLDPTRPVTAGINGFGGRPVAVDAATARPGRAGLADDPSSFALDVVGYNYKADDYLPDHQAYPHRVIYGSESYPKDVFALWDAVERHPFLLGDFVWTAIDYRGETGIGSDGRKDAKTLFVMPRFPQVTANCGDIDLVGAQRPQSFARDVVWNVRPIAMAVQRPLPDGITEQPSLWGWSDEPQSWTWPGAEGKPLAVRLYARAERIELTLNGAVVGRVAGGGAAMMPRELTVPYAPGTLEAIAYDGDRVVGRTRLTTAGPPAAVVLRPEPRAGAATRGGLCFVQVEVVDAQGRRVPDAVRAIRLSAVGPAELVAFGNAAQVVTGPLQTPQSETFDGRALAIFRTSGGRGPLRINAQAAGLAPASIRIAL